MTTFQIPAVTFAEAAKGVALAASTDANLPAFTLVQIEVTPASVIFRATDRYRVHEATVLADNPGVELSMLVDAKTLAAIGRDVAKAKAVTVDVTANDGAVRFEYEGSVKVTGLREEQFPGLAKLFEDQTTGEIAGICLNPAFLADLNAIPHKDSKRAEPMRFTFGATSSKPVRVAFEVHHGAIRWDCLIMPVRLP